jgi:hypothetical protein
MEENQYKTFVFVADNDVFHTFRIEVGPNTEPLIAGMMSNPTVVDVTGREYYSDQPGWKYSDGIFYMEENNVPVLVDEDDYEVE